MTRRHCTALMLAAGTILTSQAQATILNWAAAVSGNAGTAASWNPVQVPTAADILQFNVGGPTNSAYTVTLNAPATLSNRISVTEDIVTFIASSPHTTGTVVVGLDATPSPTMILTTGTITATVLVDLGSTVNSVGATLSVNDDDAIIQTSGSGDIRAGNVGQGILSLTNGGQAISSDDVLIGQGVGSDGLVTVTGSVGLPGVLTSRLLATSPGGDIVVGVSGTGELRPGIFSVTQCGQDLIVGQNAGSVGLITMSGGTVGVGRSFLIGGNTATTSAGTGTLELTGGSITVAGTTSVGDVNGGTGTLHMNGGTLNTGSFSLLAGGTLDFDNGTLVVNGGTFSTSTQAYGLDLSGGTSGTVRLANGATANIDLDVGGVVGETTRFEVQSGSVMNLRGSNAFQLDSTGSTTLAVSGAGTRITFDNPTSALIVGKNHAASLVIDTGGQVSQAQVFVGQSSGSNGVVSVTDTGSRLDCNTLILGGNSPTTVGSGTGSVTVGAGSVVDTANTATVWAGGTINMQGGTWEAASTNFRGTLTGFGTVNGNFNDGFGPGGQITPTGTGITFNGHLEGSGQGVTGTRITFSSTGSYFGGGVIDAEVLADAGSVITVAFPALTMGVATSGAGFVSNGLIVVGANTMTLRHSGAANVHDVTLNAGSLLCTTANIFADGTVSGSGTLGGAGRTFISRVSTSRLEPNGTLNILGNYLQANTPSSFGGTLEINATSVAGFDRITVAGLATLGGTLEGGLVPGGSMNIGDRITFLTCNSRAGVFQTVNVPGFHAEYFSNHVDLVFDGLPCDPDVNQDGNVDQDDVSYLINVVGGGFNSTGIDPDFNHDGNVDQDDVGALINVVAGGPCP